MIVTSQEDLAGMNIFEKLKVIGFREKGVFEGMPVLERGEIRAIATEKRQTEAEHLDKHFDPEYYVFASRHKSRSSIKTLTVHTPGNLTGEAGVGGMPRELAHAQPSAMKAALKELSRQKKKLNLPYRVSLETTHHGPTSLAKPVLFVEVGSTPREWNDGKAVMAVARAAVRAAECRESFTSGIGLGGNHYAPRHTEVVLKSSVALGHMVPSYAIGALEFEVFRQAVKKGCASFAYLDWKGMKKEEREKMQHFCSRISLPVRRDRELMKKLKGRELDVELGLFSEAEKAGGKRLKALKRDLDVKRDSHGEAQRVISQGTGERELMLATLEDLKSRYKLGVERGSLLLESTSIDAERAKALGLEPGPNFSQLARGKSVEVDGRLITPEMVTTRKIKRLRLSQTWLEWVRQKL